MIILWTMLALVGAMLFASLITAGLVSAISEVRNGARHGKFLVGSIVIAIFLGTFLLFFLTYTTYIIAFFLNPALIG
jgi:hypothetical protein